MAGSASAVPDQQLTPIRIFQSLNAYQLTETLKAAIELDLFSRIAEKGSRADQIASAIGASERGARILCDALTVFGFLSKESDRYVAAPDARMFLDRNSPAYIGGCAEFLLTSDVRENYSRLADAVRRGGVANEKTDTTADNNAIWIEFARAMEGIRRISSEFIADELGSAQSQDPWKVLDIAASHGLFGIAIARKNAKAEITAVDWPAVLELARTNAAKAGVAARYRTIPGDAFKVDLGSGYDIALVTAFLHHFDVPTNEAFLRRIHAALKPGGRVAILEFMPNDDRVSPPPAALFAMTMLVGTPAGDAYTYRELQQMLKNAGFGSSTLHQHPGSPDQVVIATK